MPRRSRYSGGKNVPQGRGRRPGSRGKPAEYRPSGTIDSGQTDVQSMDTSGPVSFAPVKKNTSPPAYITRELRMTAIISGALLVLLIVLSLVI